MDIWTITLLFGAGLIGGGVSAVAGGASFFTFPALLAVGLPPLVANATNFVALLPSNIAALPAFRSELKQLGRSIVLPMTLGALGGLIGAVSLLALGGGIFAAAVPYLLGMATILFAVSPYLRKALQQIRPTKAQTNTTGGMLLLFIFSVYGGFFGVGLGHVMMAVLLLNGHDDYHVANALKNILISAISLASILVYGLSDTVAWVPALIMMIGAAIGGYLGGAVSKHIPQKALRIGLVALGTVLTIYYLVAGV